MPVSASWFIWHDSGFKLFYDLTWPGFKMPESEQIEDF